MKILLQKLLLIVLILFSISLMAQRNTTNQNLMWFGYFLSLHGNKGWYLQTEVQERYFVNPTAQHQFLIRSHLHKTLGNSGWETSFGMCVFLQNSNKPKAAVQLTIPELRPHLELAYKQKLKGFVLDHRYRAEARFFHYTNPEKSELEEGFYFGNFRIRYRLQATVSVWKINDKQQLKVKLSDEILVNAGDQIVKNVFEQNRVYAGLSFDVTTNFTIDVGYLNWFQQRPDGDFYNRNILRFTVFHKISLVNTDKP